MRIQVTYDEVRRTTVKWIKCQCGKRLKRQRTFMQTLNPFNKDKATGQIKTYGQIWKELGEEGARWQPNNRLCVRCEQLEMIKEEQR